VRISFAQWFRPESRADQSSSSDKGIERPDFLARVVTSWVEMMESCLWDCQLGFRAWSRCAYCAAPNTLTDMLADEYMIAPGLEMTKNE